MNILDLPIELQTLILSHVPFWHHVFTLRKVCKLWTGIVDTAPLLRSARYAYHANGLDRDEQLKEALYSIQRQRPISRVHQLLTAYGDHAVLEMRVNLYSGTVEKWVLKLNERDYWEGFDGFKWSEEIDLTDSPFLDEPVFEICEDRSERRKNKKEGEILYGDTFQSQVYCTNEFPLKSFFSMGVDGYQSEWKMPSASLGSVIDERPLPESSKSRKRRVMGEMTIRQFSQALAIHLKGKVQSRKRGPCSNFSCSCPHHEYRSLWREIKAMVTLQAAMSSTCGLWILSTTVKTPPRTWYQYWIMQKLRKGIIADKQKLKKDKLDLKERERALTALTKMFKEKSKLK